MVVHEAVLVDVELDGPIAVDLGAPEAARADPFEALSDGDHAERVDVDERGGHVSGAADGEAESADRNRTGERGDRQIDVGAPGEVVTMGAVHLAPSAGAVGAEPQVRFVEVAEQEELANLPRGRQPQPVRDRFAPDLTRGGPPLVLPAQGQRLEVLVVPRAPPGGVAIGRESGQRISHDTRG